MHIPSSTHSSPPPTRAPPKPSTFYLIYGFGSISGVFGYVTSGSEVTFGAVDTKLYQGQIYLTPVTTETYWQIGIQEFQIEGQQTGWCSQYDGCQAIVDTGMPSLNAPSSIMSALMQYIGAQESSYGEYVADCSQFGNLPTLTFTISEVTLPLAPSTYIQETQSGYCITDIYPTYLPSQNSQPLWIFGDVRVYSSVYDREDNQAGFAQAV